MNSLNHLVYKLDRAQKLGISTTLTPEEAELALSFIPTPESPESQAEVKE